jgi:hypothetical protein
LNEKLKEELERIEDMKIYWIIFNTFLIYFQYIWRRIYTEEAQGSQENRKNNNLWWIDEIDFLKLIY